MGSPNPVLKSIHPIQYSNGRIVLSATDLSSSGFGTPWSQYRSYSNLEAVSQSGQGYGWSVFRWSFVTQSEVQIGGLPELQYIVHRGPGSQLFFLESGMGVGRFGTKCRFEHDDDNDVFVLTYPDGTRQEFADGSSGVSFGLFLRQIEPGGQETSVVSYTGRLMDEIRRSGTVDEETLIEAYVFDYNEDDLIETVTLRRKHGSGDWEDVRRAVYSYWSTGTSFGSPGDLQSVTIQVPPQGEGSSGGWENSQTTVYRYYVDLGDPPRNHLLKFVINPAVYQAMVAESVDPLTASDMTVATYANFYYEYDDANRVILERIDGGARTYTFEFTENTPGDQNQWAKRTVETRPDGSQMIVYTNNLGQGLLREHRSGSDRWIDAWHFNAKYQELWHAHPSAVLGYNDEADDLAIELREDSGLIESTEYYATSGSGAAEGYVASRSLQQGAEGTPILQASFEYLSETANGATVYLPAKSTVYRDDAGLEPIETTYAYTFYPGTVQQQQVTTTLPAIPASQNGDDTSATTRRYFDERGRLTWTMDERGFIDRTVYSLETGGILQTVQDVDTSLYDDVPDGWETPAEGGLNLVTDYVLDDRGRPVQSLGPVHQIDLDGTATTIRQADWTVYNDEHHGTYSGQGYATGTAPDYDYTLINPVSITQRDDGGKVLAQITAVAPDTEGTLAEIMENAGGGMNAYPQSSWVRWQTTQYTQCCLVASQRVYFSIPSSGEGTSGVNYNQTDYGYDSLQRRNRTVTPGGTITDVVFDPRSLVLTTYVGTNDDGGTEEDPTGSGFDPQNNMVLVTENVYDGGEDGGDGNLTQQTQYADATDTRITSMTYDFRSRLLTTTGEIDFFQKNVYDNLNKKIQVERYDTDEEGNLIARSEFLFDDRGRQYRTIRYGVNPSTGIVGYPLTSNTWYDAGRNRIQSLPAGAKLFTKTEYDSLGRPTATYSSYTPESSSSSSAPSSLSPLPLENDVILEQSETTYDDASNVIQTTSRQRYHNAPDIQLGPLGDPSTTPKARVTYAANYPDALGRTQATANYGTNGGTPLTRSSTVPARSDTILVNSQTYNDAGDVFETTDPIGMVTRFEYDDAGRQTTLLENYQEMDLSSSSSSPGSSSEETTCSASDDTNRTTLMAYTPDGQTATLTAQNASTGNQVTQYVYGTTLEDSAVASSLLLRKVIYPDSEDSSDVVQYAYNRLAQRTSLTDQNGNIHTYDYDKLGRPLHDRVTTLGSGVDGAVRRFSVEYDIRGLVRLLTSYDNSSVGSGSAVNQVVFSYNDFGQSIQTFQAHSGTVDPMSTLSVGMNYASGANNTIRPTQLVYPDGRELNYSYGAADGMDDSLSRIAALVDDDDTTNLAEYAYLGLNHVVQIDSPQADLQYTLIDLDDEDDPDTGDIYAGLDRFGRIKDCRWRNTDTEDDLSRIQYGYDRESNRSWRKNPTDPGNHHDWLYAYDGLQRLKNAQRGTLNGGHTAITAPQFAQCWTLDATGNWNGFRQDDDGTGWSLIQERTASPVNEITNIDNTTGPTWATPNYDRNGNMTAIPRPNQPVFSWSNLSVDGWGDLTANQWGGLPATASQGTLAATYDAWNRLVKLTDGEDTVQENQYDARNFRIIRKDYTEGTLSETRHFYYTDSWQDIEERLGSDTAPEQQNIWGLRYIDDLVLRHRFLPEESSSSSSSSAPRTPERLYACQDANWNVTAIVNTSGEVQERYEYDPYGNVAILSDNFTVRMTSSYGWKVLYCGHLLESHLSFYLARFRVMIPALGNWNRRDPLEYIEGMSLYLMPAVLVRSDPFGLDTWAIGGTNENDLSCQNTSLFWGQTAEPGRFYPGVGSDFNGSWYMFLNPCSPTGLGAANIASQVHSDICKAYCNNKTITINLVGWSRGAVIAIEVANLLKKTGCCCKKKRCGRTMKCIDRGFPSVNWLGLFDPVRMMWGSTFGGSIPDNVSSVTLATSDYNNSSREQLMFPELHFSQCPGLNLTHHHFPLTHGEIGTNELVLNWMIYQASQAGVNMASPPTCNPVGAQGNFDNYSFDVHDVFR